ncbi:MAG: hypothetical protein AAGA93_28240 [Actinomycetota bacterium]
MTGHPTDPVPPSDGQNTSRPLAPTSRATARAAVRTEAARVAIGGLCLGSWTEVAPRLLPRLVPVERAGALSVGIDRLDGAPGPPLRLDVAVDAGDAIVRIDEALLGSWDRSRSTVWRRATANLGARTPGIARLGGADDPIAVSDGAWTTGWVSLADQLVGRRRRSGPAWRCLAAAPGTDLLLVVATPDGQHRSTAVERLGRLARTFAAVTPEPLSTAVLVAPPPDSDGRKPFPVTAILE